MSWLSGVTFTVFTPKPVSSVTGVPAVRMVDNDVPMLGALPYESYRRWVERALAHADQRDRTIR